MGEVAANLRSEAAAFLNTILRRLGLQLVRSGPLAARALTAPQTPLLGERAALRRLTLDDASGLLGLRDNPDIAYWIGWTAPTTSSTARRWIRGQESTRIDGAGLSLALIERQTRRFAGLVELHQVDWSYGRASIGLWLLPQSRGKGLMTEGLNLLVAWVFERTPLQRLEFLTLAENAPAIALAERCGFTREGILRGRIVRNGEPRNAVLLSILRGDQKSPRIAAE